MGVARVTIPPSPPLLSLSYPLNENVRGDFCLKLKLTELFPHDAVGVSETAGGHPSAPVLNHFMYIYR